MATKEPMAYMASKDEKVPTPLHPQVADINGDVVKSKAQVKREKHGVHLGYAILVTQSALVVMLCTMIEWPEPGSSCMFPNDNSTARLQLGVAERPLRLSVMGNKFVAESVATGNGGIRALPGHAYEHCTGSDHDASINYLFFIHVSFMMYFGFGYLMAYLRNYMASAIGFTMFITAVAMQLTIALQGPMLKLQTPYPITIVSMTEGMFGAATCLISFGVIVGVASPIQLLIMVLLEVPAWLLNMYLCFEHLDDAPIDIGGSIFVHMFGAYFGVGCSMTMNWGRHAALTDNRFNGNSYMSDIFSFIGVVFLLVLWPSFNAGLAPPSLASRTMVNTVLSIGASTVVSFGMSVLVSGSKAFQLGGADVQNGVLSGGVAAGAIANMKLGRPGLISIVGAIAGVVCVLGYEFVSGFLTEKMSLHDTAGVHNLHGMPSVIGAIASVIVMASEHGGDNWFVNDTVWKSQLYSMFITLGISGSLGALTGLVLRPLNQDLGSMFRDDQWWDVATDFFSGPGPVGTHDLSTSQGQIRSVERLRKAGVDGSRSNGHDQPKPAWGGTNVVQVHPASVRS